MVRVSPSSLNNHKVCKKHFDGDKLFLGTFKN